MAANRFRSEPTLPSINSRPSAFNQLSRAERSRLPPEILEQLSKDPAEQTDSRSLEWLNCSSKGRYFSAPPTANQQQSSTTIEAASIKRANQAQELCNRAFHAPYLHADRVKFAQEARELAPDFCADCFNLLAEEEAETVEDALHLYTLGVRAGLQAILNLCGNKDALVADTGDRRQAFLPLLPYMRSLVGTGACQFKLKQYGKACNMLERYFRLDDRDSLLARPIWLACKLHLNDLPSISHFYQSGVHMRDPIATLFYIQAYSLWVFKDERKDDIESALSLALDCNLFIAMILLGRSNISALRIPPPNTVHFGYLSEVVMFCHLFQRILSTEFLVKILKPQYDTYISSRGWTDTQLTSHCLTAALYASFGGQIPFEMLTGTAKKSVKASNTLPSAARPNSASVNR